MNADAAFVTGKTHRVCQDYARADKGGQYVIVSDGCSSSPDTDFGARLLVKSVENNLAAPTEAVANAQAAARVLLLSEYALDATLFTARYVPTADNPPPFCNSIEVRAFGDGVIASVDKQTSEIRAFHIEYPSGYPPYINYRSNAARHARLQEITKGNHVKLTEWNLRSPSDYEEIKPLPPIEGAPADRGPWDADGGFRMYYDADRYSVLALFTDGVNSFTDSSLATVPWQSVVAEMMVFGTARKGEFVQRQMNWMSKETRRRKWTHADDFTMGAINL